MTEQEQYTLFESLTRQSGLTFEEGREDMMFTVAKQIFAWSAVLSPAQDATREPATCYAAKTVPSQPASGEADHG